MDKYKIITDKNFFDKFETLSLKIKLWGNLFQNTGVVVDHRTVEEWYKFGESLYEHLQQLKHEGSCRIVKLN